MMMMTIVEIMTLSLHSVVREKKKAEAEQALKVIRG
jgi:hypothetical protein